MFSWINFPPELNLLLTSGGLVAMLAFIFKVSSSLQTKKECSEKHTCLNADYEKKWNFQGETLKLLGENVLQMRDDMSAISTNIGWMKDHIQKEKR